MSDSLPDPQQAAAKAARAAAWWRVATLLCGLAAIAALAMALYLIDLAEKRDQQLAQAGSTRAVLGQQSAQLEQMKAQLAQLQARPDIRYVAVLSDDHSAAAVLVTFDPAKNSLVARRVGAYQEAADKSLQLWGVPEKGKPQSPGVLERGARETRFTVTEQQLKQSPVLGVSLEPKGGVASARGPTGLMLFSGAVVAVN